jgi:hypothetical protein
MKFEKNIIICFLLFFYSISFSTQLQNNNFLEQEDVFLNDIYLERETN